MNNWYLLGLAAAFFAAVLLVYGLYDLLWARWSSDRRRLEKRLAQLRNASSAARSITLFRNKTERSGWAIEKAIAQLPRYGSLAQLLAQAGYAVGPGSFLTNCLLIVVVTFAGLLLLGATTLTALVVSLLIALLPALRLWIKREQRMRLVESQLPDTVDLIARSLRAGHALSPSLQMVAEEMPDPIASEFRQVSEEIAFGIPIKTAMTSLVQRLPLDDVRFFVIAVLLQRDTGGNLAEILDNIGRLIRERLKLMGQVRVLTAEGRMSGWALSLLPFATALLIYFANREFISSLWQDPTGLQMIVGAVALMLVGIFWMWRLVRIRI